MTGGYSVAQTARLVCALRWICERSAEFLGAWAQQADNDAEAAVTLHEASRRLAAHRDVLDGLQPDSELMAPWRQPAPSDDASQAALEQIAQTQGSGGRVVAAQDLARQLHVAYVQIVEHAAGHCDGALAAAARRLAADIATASASESQTAVAATTSSASAPVRQPTAAVGAAEGSASAPASQPAGFAAATTDSAFASVRQPARPAGSSGVVAPARDLQRAESDEAGGVIAAPLLRPETWE